MLRVSKPTAIKAIHALQRVGTRIDKAAILRAVAAGAYGLVIVDPFYRFL